MKPWEIGLISGGAVIAAAVAAWPVLIWYEVKKCEKPKYDVMRPLVGSSTSWWTGKATAELRKYSPYIIAETRIQGNMKKAANTGFRRIAGYIFGGNKAIRNSGKESIAMTSPVIMEKAGSSSEKIATTSPMQMQEIEQGEYTMAFVMPSKYSLSTLPRPDSEDVRLREVPGCMAAALAFSGHVGGEQVWRDKEQELLGMITAEGLAPVGSPQLLQYHPPFAPGWMRHNEVLYVIKDV